MLFVGVELRLALRENDDEQLQGEWVAVIAELEQLLSAAKEAVDCPLALSHGSGTDALTN